MTLINKHLLIYLAKKKKILLGIYFPQKENANLERCIHPYAHGSIIYNCQDMKATCVH